MLDVEQLDLDELTHALQDHSSEHEWWFDPANGELVLWSHLVGDELGEGHPDERGMLFVEPVPSHAAYDDMVDFARRVSEPDLRRRLERALDGRGAFRRFKDELYDHPEQRAAWHRFSDARMARRAADWLEGHEVISGEARDALVSAHPDPAPAPPLGPRARLASAVARDLQELFGDRLQEVLMFGSSARGEADAESDLDLLVILGGAANFWADHALMDEILWRHTLDSGIVVSALPVSADDARVPAKPALRRALDEGVRVG